MIAEFEVHETIVLEDRSLFALTGEMVEGMPRTGMRAVLAGREAAFSERVHGVEFVASPNEDAAPDEPALTFYYGDVDTLEGWRDLEWPGSRLRLEWGE